MKNSNSFIKKELYCFLLISIFLIIYLMDINAQLPGTDESIAKNRKGELIIKAKRGAKVMVEQLSHEFWFGCAISNSIAGGGMSENDLRQYKEKFLKNFNSAVTENAVKWANMERIKGQVNYSVVDAISLRMHWTLWQFSSYQSVLLNLTCLASVRNTIKTEI